MSDIKSRLERIFKAILAYNGEMNDNCSMESIEGWDSLSHINLIFSIEEEFNMVVDEEEMSKMINFAEIMKIMEYKLKN